MTPSSTTSGPVNSPGRANEAGDAAAAVREADLWQVQGNRLFLLNEHRGFTSVTIDPLVIEGRLQLTGSPRELFVDGNRCCVLIAHHDQRTELLELDLTQPTAPVLSAAHGLPGDFLTTRRVGDRLYVVTTGAVRSFDLTTAPLQQRGEYLSPTPVHVAQAGPDRLILVGMNANSTGSVVRAIDIGAADGSLHAGALLELPGALTEDQRMDCAQHVLRLCTYDWQQMGVTRLYTIDVADVEQPHVMAMLPVALGERLFGVEFTADRAYLVTFLQIDPLWVIDLSNPYSPAVLGELEVPGWSTQLVCDGTQIVALGMNGGFVGGQCVSLFDVGNPTQPVLLDRVDLPGTWSHAQFERKGWLVSADKVLLPTHDGCAVIDRTASDLSLRGSVPVAAGSHRALRHGTELLAFGSEQLVAADLQTLSVRNRVTLAENIVDCGRLADGTLIELRQMADRAEVGGIELPLTPYRMFAFLDHVAVLGYDQAGHCAFLVDFAQTPPAVQPRIGLDVGGFALPGSAHGPGAGPGLAFAAFPQQIGPQAVLTDSGMLIVRGLPTGAAIELGTGALTDGLITLDLALLRPARGVRVHGGAITGMTAGAHFATLTVGAPTKPDLELRPMLQHALYEVDFQAGTGTRGVAVPGYLMQRLGDRVFVVRDRWTNGWDTATDVVACRLAGGLVQELSRLPAAGSTNMFVAQDGTLCYQQQLIVTLGWWSQPQLSAQVHSMRLQDVLAHGPSLPADQNHRPLLVEHNHVLVTRDERTCELWSLAGDTASLRFAEPIPGTALQAYREHTVKPSYLLALGYAGSVVVF